MSSRYYLCSIKALTLVAAIAITSHVRAQEFVFSHVPRIARPTMPTAQEIPDPAKRNEAFLELDAQHALRQKVLNMFHGLTRTCVDIEQFTEGYEAYVGVLRPGQMRTTAFNESQPPALRLFDESLKIDTEVQNNKRLERLEIAKPLTDAEKNKICQAFEISREELELRYYILKRSYEGYDLTPTAEEQATLDALTTSTDGKSSPAAQSIEESTAKLKELRAELEKLKKAKNELVKAFAEFEAEIKGKTQEELQALDEDAKQKFQAKLFALVGRLDALDARESGVKNQIAQLERRANLNVNTDDKEFGLDIETVDLKSYVDESRTHYNGSIAFVDGVGEFTSLADYPKAKSFTPVDFLGLSNVATQNYGTVTKDASAEERKKSGIFWFRNAVDDKEYYDKFDLDAIAARENIKLEPHDAAYIYRVYNTNEASVRTLKLTANGSTHTILRVYLGGRLVFFGELNGADPKKREVEIPVLLSEDLTRLYARADRIDGERNISITIENLMYGAADMYF